jgi:hypothetical protein
MCLKKRVTGGTHVIMDTGIATLDPNLTKVVANIS